MKKLTKTELEKLYYSNKNEAVCKILGISIPTLLVYLEKLDIKPKGKGYKRGKYELIDDES